jgi:hypothetical protein
MSLDRAQESKEILARIDRIISEVSPEHRKTLALWYFDEECLIKEDIQYGGFLDLDPMSMFPRTNCS